MVKKRESTIHTKTCRHEPQRMIQSTSHKPCPLCDGSPDLAFEADGHAILDCANCHHRYADIEADAEHVRQVYADDYFDGGGAGYDDYLAEGATVRRQGEWYGRLLAKYMSPGRVLDVGAAAGFLLDGLMAHGWTGEGLEPNATMCRHARDRSRHTMHVGTLETFTGRGEFDLISMVQVLAHFTHPRRALETANRLTKFGGYWLIETWDFKSLTSRMFGKRWHEYSPPSVLHWFTPASVRVLAGSLGYEVVAQGRPQKRLQVGHAASLIRHKTEGSLLRPLALPLSLLPRNLELPYPGNDLFWMLLRKQGFDTTSDIG